LLVGFLMLWHENKKNKLLRLERLHMVNDLVPVGLRCVVVGCYFGVSIMYKHIHMTLALI
jgi:hypothetical protein